MKKGKRKIIKCFSVLLSTLIMCFGFNISAQAVQSLGDGGYIVAPPSGPDITEVFNIVGTTKVDSQYPNTAIVTLDTPNQFGALWAKEQLDLTKNFSTEMYMYLGHAAGKSGTLADGMTFTMHNNTTALTQMVGGRGEGLGVYRGRMSTGGNSTKVDGTYLKNSLAIEFDTYRNMNDGWSYVVDPAYSAHCSVITPKANNIYLSDHKNTFSFSPAQKWVKFEAEWTPNGSNGGTLTYSFNGMTKQQYSISNVTSVFGGTKVYWGFTGATGKYSSVQAVAITKLPSTAKADPSAAKTSANLTTPFGRANVGDIIEYTITAANNGDASSKWENVAITDTLPNGVTLVDNSVTLNGVAVQHTYNPSTRLLTVNLDSIAGGVTKTLVFRVKIDDDAYGKTIINRADVGGINVSDTGYTVIEKSSPPVIDKVMENAEIVTGTGIPGSEVTVTLPNGTMVSATVEIGGTWTINVPKGVRLNGGDVISAVQQETSKVISDAAYTTVVGDPTADPDVDVYVENMTTGEIYAQPGDSILYDVVVMNNGSPSSVWPSAYVTFYLNESVILQESSIRINYRTVTPSQYSYDSAANTLTIYLGDISGGSSASITFRTIANSYIASIDETVLNASLGSLISRSLIYQW